MESTTAAIAYEVTAEVGESLRDHFERYMVERHIPDLMETGCFMGAQFERTTSGIYRTRYEAYDRAALERYIKEHAARLREHVAEKFPEGITFNRVEWETLASFE